MIHIDQLVPGDRVRLLGYGQTALPYKRRLMSLGMTSGTEFSVVRLAPLGCPVQIEVKGASLSLRKDEARGLLLERL